MAETTRSDLIRRADDCRRAADTAPESQRANLLRLARDLYREAGLHGFARWCERWLG